jgi:hypothetical protein
VVVWIVSPGQTRRTGGLEAENWRWNVVGTNSWRCGGPARFVGIRAAVHEVLNGCSPFAVRTSVPSMRSPEMVPLNSSEVSSPFSVNLMAVPFTVPSIDRRPIVPETEGPSTLTVSR